MKKLFYLFSVVLVITLVATGLTAYADDGKVEISFCVGDNTLLINGQSVKVEKPYVVGAGVTLVPLRVITEAFGATVEWIDETQTVNITYPQVKIVLQINNIIADVNNKAQTLLSAPELTESGYTMVPLRFISENFGADVSYDDSTEKITVVKDNNEDTQNMVVGEISQSKIGDSYYGWSMDKPEAMTMAERSFEGTYTCFEYDDTTWLDIEIDTLPEDYDFERDFVEGKNSFQGYTLIKAEKKIFNDNKKMIHFQAKDKYCIMDVYKYVTDKYTFFLYGETEPDNNVMASNISKILASFDCSFSSEDVYDLSEVDDGMRKYKSEKMNFSIDIPQDYYLSTFEELDNEVKFYRLNNTDESSSIGFYIYSKSEVGDVKELANKDYTGNKKILNEKIAKFSNGVYEKTYNSIKVYEYTFEVDCFGENTVTKDVFFELGDYSYNICITLDKDIANKDEVSDRILNSIVVNPIDASKIGMLMRNIPDDEGTFAIKGEDWTVTVPNVYEKEQPTENSVVMVNMRTATMITMETLPANNNKMGYIKDLLKESQTNLGRQNGVKLIKDTTDVKIGDYKYAMDIHEIEAEGQKTYLYQYGAIGENKIIIVTAIFAEKAHSEYNLEEVNNIISSIKLN